MRDVLIVAAGGGLGSAGLYLLSGFILHRAASWQFPLGTFVVKHELLSPEIRLLLFTGVAGGFTTFSAFGLETFYLLRKGEVGIAAAYVALSVLVGMLMLWVGFAVVPRAPS